MPHSGYDRTFFLAGGAVRPMIVVSAVAAATVVHSRSPSVPCFQAAARAARRAVASMVWASRRGRAVALELLLGGDLKLLDGDLALIVLVRDVVVKGVGVLPQVGVAFLFFKSSRLCRSWSLHARARSGASSVARDGRKCQACQSESIHPPRERVPYAWHARGALVTDQGRAERRRRASCRCRIYCEVSGPRPNNAVS